jgi:hypothetical protein
VSQFHSRIFKGSRAARACVARRFVFHAHQVVPKELLRVFNPEEMQVR